MHFRTKYNPPKSRGLRWVSRLNKMKTDYKPLILFVIRLILGITFVYSSYHKIEDPAAFAKIVYGYAVFPTFSINIIAIIFPFIELTAGFCLIFNLLPRPAVLIINCLLVAFIILIEHYM